MLFLTVNLKLAKLSATCVASFRDWLLACMLIAGFATPARGVLWDGGGSTSAWIEPANWQFNAIPTTADTATIISDVATIDAVIVPTVMAVELGMGSLSGGLVITGGSNPGRLNVVTNVAIASAGSLTLGGGGPAASQVTAASLTTGGTLMVFDRGTVNLSGSLTQTGGAFNLNGGTVDASTVLIQAGAFHATGDVIGNVTIGNGVGAVATLAPGQSLDIDGNLKLAADARLEIEFRSGAFEQIEISGAVTLGGTLDLAFLGGAPPTPGVIYSVLTANGLEGAFTEILGSGVGGGSWIPEFDLTNGIRFSYTELPGNMNGDDTVDELDVELFAHAIRDPNTYHVDFYLAGDVADSFLADMDGDGSNTFADIPPSLEAIENFGGSAQAAFAEITRLLAVPEPSSQTAMFVAIVLSPAIRRLARPRGRSA
jgi:hypothetical protein